MVVLCGQVLLQFSVPSVVGIGKRDRLAVCRVVHQTHTWLYRVQRAEPAVARVVVRIALLRFHHVALRGLQTLQRSVDVHGP